nr:imidazole glycerol phosphate synthase [uncultured Campylobacter sp.]
MQFSTLTSWVKEQGVKTSGYFSAVFDNEDYYANVSAYLSQILLEISLKSEKSSISTVANHKLQVAAKNIKYITELLQAQSAIMQKYKRRSFFNNDATRLRAVKTQLAVLLKAQSRLDKLLKMQASIISNVILGEFKMVYKFLLYSVFLAKSRGHQLLLVEIISVCDKIAAMIGPIFSNQSLKTSELVYRYLVYELRE